MYMVKYTNWVVGKAVIDNVYSCSLLFGREEFSLLLGLKIMYVH